MGVRKLVDAANITARQSAKMSTPRIWPSEMAMGTRMTTEALLLTSSVSMVVTA